MSNTISTRTSLPLPSMNRPVFDFAKQPPKDDNPLHAVNQGPLRQATKPDSPPQISTVITDEARAKALEAAEGLISTTFIEPILKQVRESNNTPPPFGPSRAEKQFATMLDTKLADEIVHAANFPLVKRLTAEMLRNMPAQAMTNQATNQATNPALTAAITPALDIEG